MTDDLRTRIAAVQLAHSTAGPENPHNWLSQTCKCGHALTATNIEGLAAVWADHLADAVIRELGNLRWEVHAVSGDGFNGVVERRVISDWTTDE